MEEEQRLKQVSVLFADVVGSTALAHRLDPEDMQAVMDGALARFTAVVQAHGGRVLQYAGDSLLAVFGASLAREDDALRAVQAGLGILAEGRSRAALVQAEHGSSGFDVRAGVHTGSVLLGGGVDGEHAIRGLTVHIAARMEQTAPPGALRISQDTYRQVRGWFDLLEQPPLQVKGAEEPMLTYLVQGLRRAAGRQRTHGVEGVSSPLVGRGDELKALHSAYEESGARRLTIIGDAGLGKSRLLDEFRRWADARAPRPTWLHAQASEQAMSRPYGVLRELLCSRIDLLDSDPAELAREKWLQAAAPLLDSTGDAAVLGHLLGFDFADHPELQALADQPKALRERAVTQAARLLQALGREGPLVAAIDDLHWADEPTLDVVDQWLSTEPAPPLLLIGLARPALFERRPAWGRHPERDRRVALIPLPAGSAQALADALLARLHPPAEDLRALVAEQAEGNPFHMEELVNMLIDQRVILAEGPQWRLQRERLHGLKLPTTLVGVLQARLDALPTDQRRTAQLAAVVGFRFWDASLVALGAPLPEGLQGLIDRELALTAQSSSLEGMREYSFKHHTLQQVTYDSVLKQLKRRIHAQVARWLVGLPGETQLDLVAEHYERGGEAALALEYWQRAADAAAARYANANALAHAGRALGLCADEDLSRRHALTLLRCRVLEMTSERGALARELDTLLALAEGLSDEGKRSEALRRRARNVYDQGDAAAALAIAMQAVACAPPEAPGREANARALVAQCLIRLGRFAEAREESMRALGLAQAAGDIANEGMILNDLGLIANAQGDHGAEIECYEQALLRHRASGLRDREAGTLSNLGYAALVLGDYDSASAQFEQARQLFARIGNRQNEGITLINLAMARQYQGRSEDALALAREALALLNTARDRWAQAAALRVMGQAALGADGAAAARHFEASRDLFDELRMSHLALEAVAGLAEAALARGEPATALAHAEDVLARLARGVTLEGTEEPMRVQLACCRALEAAADPRAEEIREQACRTLQERAGRISDPARRHAFLHDVPYHRELLARALRRS